MMAIRRTILAVLAIGIGMAVSAQADLITLVDLSTLNGGFELYTTNQGDGIGRFSSIQNWFNYGAGSETGTDGRSTAPVYAGVYSAIASVASTPSLNTGHVLVSGDTFTLSFAARSPNTTALNVTWHLYYYTNGGTGGFDETSDTSGVDILTGSTPAPGTSWATPTVISDASFSDSNAIGKTLYLRFHRTDTAGFPRVDNVTLTVNTIPEPMAAGLIGWVVALALLRRRRDSRG